MSTAVLREVRLYGVLGREFGRVFRLAVATPAEAVRALRAVLPGFERALLGADGQREYHVFVGRGAHRRDISEGQLREPIGSKDAIRIVPVVAGAKRGGVLQTIVGAVLVVVGLLTSAYGGSALVSIGASMIIGGVIQMLSPQNKGKDSAANNLPSYVFDSPINNTQQGGPVPVRYGRGIWGSVVISQGISTDQVAVATAAPIPSNVPTLPTYEPTDPYEDRGGGA